MKKPAHTCRMESVARRLYYLGTLRLDSDCDRILFHNKVNHTKCLWGDWTDVKVFMMNGTSMYDSYKAWNGKGVSASP